MACKKVIYASFTCGVALSTMASCSVSLDDASWQQDAASSERETKRDSGGAPPMAALDASAPTGPLGGKEGGAVPARAGESSQDDASDAGNYPEADMRKTAGTGGANGSAGHAGTSVRDAPGPATGPIEELAEPEDLSKKCVDVTDAKTVATDSELEGRRIQFWECSKDTTPNPAQRWTIDAHTIRAFGRCLTASEETTSDGRVMLELRTCQPSLDRQQWWLCAGQLLNKAYGTCLDLMAESDRMNGGAVQLWECYEQKPNQSWRLPDGLEEIREPECPATFRAR